jgi:hypothetical protein
MHSDLMTSIEAALSYVQVVATFLIFCTFVVYYFQLRTMQAQLRAVKDAASSQNLLTVIAFIQDEQTRLARDHVINQLSKRPMDEWNPADRRAAHKVCANYDILAILLQRGIVDREPIIENWAPSILKCFDTLLPYVLELQRPERSGPDYWNEIPWLLEQCQMARGKHAGSLDD